MRHIGVVLPRLLALTLWALVAGLTTFWALRLFSTSHAPPLPPAPPPLSRPLPVDARALARILGDGAAADAPQVAATPAKNPAPDQPRLLGVLAGHDSGAGVAVIAVGQQGAKPFRVGSPVGENGLVLQSLSAHEARLGASLEAPASVTLHLAVPPPAAMAAPAPRR